MKSLLLPLLAALTLPTAVNAFPWSSDIVVKNDLGEKFVVKESAVNIILLGVNDLIKTINEDIVEWDYMIPTDPAVKPTARKKINSSKSLGREFTKRLIWVIWPCAPQVFNF